LKAGCSFLDTLYGSDWMNVTFSPTANTVLSRHKTFQDNLLEALSGLPGTCYIDVRVGRTPPDDCLILMSQNREPLSIPYFEFANQGDRQGVVQLRVGMTSPGQPGRCSGGKGCG
jgi:hypothetical protein